MHDESRLRSLQNVLSYLEDDESQDETAIPAPCYFTPEKCDPADKSIRINSNTLTFKCRTCPQQGTIEKLEARLKAGQPPQPAMQVIDVEYDEPQKVQRNLIRTQNDEIALKVIGDAASPEPAMPSPRPRRGHGERIIITLLSLIFLTAGLAAAALSGFANYQAFSGSVADALQSQVWGWTGVIASVISFGGFTFFYWHMANGRRGEGWRTALFALSGAATSIIGTQMYIENNNLLAASEVQQAGTNRAVIEAQIEDWRTQLAGIPPETRTVEGLEAYIAEVERVGRTHQKPYRDAQNELGLAKRRDDLEAKIETANAQLIGVSDTGVVTAAAERQSIPSWFFAIMLELFSSQGTSIASVALLILYGGRRQTIEKE